MYDAEVQLSSILSTFRALRLDTQVFGGWEGSALADYNNHFNRAIELLMQYLRDNESRLSKIEEKLEWLRSIYGS
jgi:hypothetical protein